jgi:hypothetical protein
MTRPSFVTSPSFVTTGNECSDRRNRSDHGGNGRLLNRVPLGRLMSNVKIRPYWQTHYAMAANYCEDVTRQEGCHSEHPASGTDICLRMPPHGGPDKQEPPIFDLSPHFRFPLNNDLWWHRLI